MIKTNSKDKFSWLRWVILALIVVSGFVSIKGGIWAILIYFLPTVFVFMHGSRFLGKKNILIFFAVVFVVTFVAEYLGVNTGKLLRP